MIFTEWHMRRPDTKKPIVFLKRRSQQGPADLTFNHLEDIADKTRLFFEDPSNNVFGHYLCVFEYFLGSQVLKKWMSFVAKTRSKIASAPFLDTFGTLFSVPNRHAPVQIRV